MIKTELKRPSTQYLIKFLQGYNGSQLWDTAFTVQAIISTNLIKEYGTILKKAHTYVKNSQVLYI